MAAAGEIGVDDRQLLKAHLEECVDCRALYADMAKIHSSYLPEYPGSEIIRDKQSDIRLRDAILKLATKEGARFSRVAKAGGETRQSDGTSSRAWVVFAASAAMLSLAIGLLVVQARAPRGDFNAVLQVPTIPAPTVQRSVGAFDEATLQETIEIAKSEQLRLRGQLTRAQHANSQLESSTAGAEATIADLKRRLESAQASQARAQQELADVRNKQASMDVIATLQQSEIQKLNKKLADQTTNFERERQALSLGGKEARDLIAARNLHIIDVYDTNTRGKTGPAFGRIFYTEGKSLIFYAYDLNGKQADNGKTTFYVWGKRDGAPQAIKSLGALTKDDHAQKRWIFTTTDTKILASIDSVFVTTESNEKPGTQPKGKPMLSAFLGTAANHP